MAKPKYPVILSFTCTEALAAAVRVLSDELGMSVSETCRFLVQERLVPPRPWSGRGGIIGSTPMSSNPSKWVSAALAEAEHRRKQASEPKVHKVSKPFVLVRKKVWTPSRIR